MMATGKKAKDIFTRTTGPADVSLEVSPHKSGRPKASQPYQKVTVCLFDRQVWKLDEVRLAINKTAGLHVSRAELIRGIVDAALAQVKPDRDDGALQKIILTLKGH